MSQTGFTPIQLYRTTTGLAVPLVGNLADGELAINTTDGKLYYKSTNGTPTVQLLASNALVNGVFPSGIAVGSGTTGGETNISNNRTPVRTGFGPVYGTNTDIQVPLNTSAAYGYRSILKSIVTNPSLNIFYYYYAEQGTITGTAPNDQTAFWSNGNLIAATNNYAFVADAPSPALVTGGKRFYSFYSNAAEATGGGFSYQVYASGTAHSYFNGFVGVKKTNPTTELDVNGTVTATSFAGPINGTIGATLPNTGAFTTVTTTGSLGVGTSTPVCNLDVVGGIKTSRTGVTTPAATDGNIFSGSYTAAQVGTNTNVLAVIFGTNYYMRVGNMVTVVGQVEIDATTANTDTVVRMSLPIASNFTTSRQLGGSANSIDGGIFGAISAAILGDTTNDCAEFRLRPTNTNSNSYQFSFTYNIA